VTNEAVLRDSASELEEDIQQRVKTALWTEAGVIFGQDHSTLVKFGSIHHFIGGFVD
jgi:hypothetical protein